MVYLEERTHCRCGAPLMPLVSCEECNESFLQAATKSSSSALVDPTQQQDDEFALEDETTEADDQTKDKDTVSSIQILITNRAVKNGSADFLDRATHRLTPNRPADGGIEPAALPHCQERMPLLWRQYPGPQPAAPHAHRYALHPQHGDRHPAGVLPAGSDADRQAVPGPQADLLHRQPPGHRTDCHQAAAGLRAQPDSRADLSAPAAGTTRQWAVRRGLAGPARPSNSNATESYRAETPAVFARQAG